MGGEGAEMKIDGNRIEKEALAAFDRDDRDEGWRLQNRFLEEFHKAYDGKDHCPCTDACKLHGKCRECVAVHRAHQGHLPNCLKPMVNEKIRELSQLTEHSFCEEE